MRWQRPPARGSQARVRRHPHSACCGAGPSPPPSLPEPAAAPQTGHAAEAAATGTAAASLADELLAARQPEWNLPACPPLLHRWPRPVPCRRSAMSSLVMGALQVASMSSRARRSRGSRLPAKNPHQAAEACAMSVPSPLVLPAGPTGEGGDNRGQAARAVEAEPAFVAPRPLLAGPLAVLVGQGHVEPAGDLRALQQPIALGADACKAGCAPWPAASLPAAPSQIGERVVIGSSGLSGSFHALASYQWEPEPGESLRFFPLAMPARWSSSSPMRRTKLLLRRVIGGAFRRAPRRSKATASGAWTAPGRGCRALEAAVAESQASMAALICGSLAFDNIMTFDGRFADQILPDQLHILIVSYLVPPRCAAISVAARATSPMRCGLLGAMPGPGIARAYSRPVAGHAHGPVHDHDGPRQQPDHGLSPGRLTAGPRQPDHAARSRACAWASIARWPPGHAGACGPVQGRRHSLCLRSGPGPAHVRRAGTARFIEQGRLGGARDDYEARMLSDTQRLELAQLSGQVQGLVVTLGRWQAGEVWVRATKTAGGAVQAAPWWQPTGFAAMHGAGALLFGLERGWDLVRCAERGNRLVETQASPAAPAETYVLGLRSAADGWGPR
ncbi:hypothetical protein FQR65_LT20178 [Abscondita terminalis]|nr:hypothetical protein FQR65_LT20178 [Abscondita terminalis]